MKALVCVGVMLLTGVSCEKMNVGESDDVSQANVVLRVGSIEQIPFPVTTRASVEGSCTSMMTREKGSIMSTRKSTMRTSERHHSSSIKATIIWW